MFQVIFSSKLPVLNASCVFFMFKYQHLHARYCQCTDVDGGATVARVVDSSLCRLRCLAPCWSVEVNESFCLLDDTVAAATTLVTRV